jgi:hypothetical protein
MGYGRTEVAFSNMFVTPQERSFPELRLKKS